MNPRAASERMDFMAMDFRLGNSVVGEVEGSLE